MPYRHAWVFIIALLTATFFAFWRSYFSILPTASVGFHIHGITASLWMLLLLAQSRTPHRGQIAMHRRLGQATFVAVPLFSAGSMGVIHSMAVGTATGDPFYALWGAPLAFIDWLAFGAVLFAVGMALRHRREVRLHSGYMLSTVLMLLSPVLGRVINKTVPGLIIGGPKDFPVFGWGVQLANFIAGAIALWLWRRDPRTGRPWAVALGVIVVQIVGFQTWGTSEGWRLVSTALGTRPLGALLAFGIVAGAATVIIGWSASGVGRKQSAET
ncbi:hypothetical protein [Novosphingobium sp. JCM 18896]|uniref:hypothetical protein n=1 Tax=Novosphingobium sp. JCM 18896 TaxID=2989731 RepID=UPI002221F9DB|nr:hypothetical protein [Novosphingobium sp. JCM 18896]MCW1432259.1 hypothetical protein [Novosphingobium sp. JCM 18896]